MIFGISGCAGLKELALFWRTLQQRGSDIVRDRVGLTDRWAHKTLPIGLHGDGGAFSKQDGLFVLSRNSICGAEAAEGFGRRFLYTIVKKSAVVECTMEVLWKVFAWSMTHLLTGLTPEESWDGAPLPDGLQFLVGGSRGAFVQIRGDWEIYSNILELPAWNLHRNMCCLCRATNLPDGLSWRQLTDTTGWRATRRTHDSWRAELAVEGRRIPTIFVLCFGLTLSCAMIDVLHAVDQGVASHLVANIFVYCIKRNVWGGGSQAKNVELLNEELVAWQKRNKATSRLRGSLKIERLRTTGGWPKLKAKAAATRHICEFALELAQRECTADRRIIAAAQLLCE